MQQVSYIVNGEKLVFFPHYCGLVGERQKSGGRLRSINAEGQMTTIWLRPFGIHFIARGMLS
jgi:hypothetical protein